MPDTIQIKIPNIGDYSDIPVVEIFVNPGDEVSKDDPIIALESDKAVMEVPSPETGKIISIDIKLNDTVSEGDSVATLEVSSKSAADEKSAEKEKTVDSKPAKDEDKKDVQPPKPQKEKSSESVPVESSSDSGKTPHASPSIRLFARELGVDLSLVSGTGPKNRITKEDVQKFVKSKMSGTSSGTAQTSIPVNIDEFKKYGEVEIIPFKRIQKIAGPRLQQSWQVIPHVTHFDEADIQDLEDFRKQTNQKQEDKNAKLTLLAFAVKASVIALKEYPEFNSSILENGSEYVTKKYYNIGFAVDTEDGLIVPVIKNADRKGLLEIGTELKALGEKARKGSLSMDDITGATFTISSLGSIGGTGFTPIILPPQAAILGLSRGYIKPKYDKQNNNFIPRYTLPFSLSYDHRLIDGALAARFCAFLSEELGDVRNLLL